MSEVPSASPSPVQEPAPEATRIAGNFFRQFVALSSPYWNSEEKLKVRVLTLLLVVLTICQVGSPILINLWSKQLFNALEQRNLDQLLAMILALAGILAFAMGVTATHMVVKRRIQVGWRQWLTRRLLDNWMSEGRHYQLSYIPGEHDNPDGRIAEDIRNATESAIDLAHSLLYAFLLLVSFTQILWVLSGVVQVQLFGMDFGVPGHMVFISFVYAGAGTTAALLIGRPLVKAANKRQTNEANFRFGLVRVRENSESIALMHGETDERRRLRNLFTGVITAWDRQTSALARVFLFSSGYSVLATGFPILITAPRYITGSITLGELMQIAQAFQQMTAALSWPVDNLSKAAEWKASVERVLSLENALATLNDDLSCRDNGRICLTPTDHPVLAFRDLCIANPDGRVVVSGLEAEILKGEKVLISGDPVGSVKLFKVVSGLWPWGSGRVDLPFDGTIAFLPERPYIPIGSLRGVLSYPKDPETYTIEEYAAALHRGGLGHLEPRLREQTAWEQILAPAEQQVLGFTRLLLSRPDWVFLEHATSSLSPQSEEEMMHMLEQELPGATVLTIGHNPSLEAFHQRKLTLETTLNGPAFLRETSLTSVERRRRMTSMDLRHWLIHPLRRAGEKPRD
ncbi:MAG: ABC transporter ATP-binding protein/permease [Magnetospirillum sp.]|nr:ABC transporter ATP-binding protein/permease [Magnetospirillum sp.]